jgi:hypothetical protein
MSKIIRPDKQPGWSSEVPEPGPGSEFANEFDLARGRVVIEYTASPLARPQRIPIPFGLLAALAGTLLSNVYAKAQVAPAPEEGLPT